MMKMKWALACLILSAPALAQNADLAFLNRNKPLVDAHNCYPYAGRWADRITRALSTGFPVAIEQDVAWNMDPATGNGRVVVSHEAKTSGSEPLLRDYFFETVRPQIEKALRDGDRNHWPLVVLHFDFKDNQPALLHAVWELLGEFKPWLTTAVKTANPHALQTFDRKPIFVVTEDSDAQEEVFFHEVPVGGRLRLFGSAHTTPIPGTAAERIHSMATLPPDRLLSERPTNYRRWWNNSWFEVEEGGQAKAGAWTPEDNARLTSLVNHAHKLGFWIRFYTLDGFAPDEDRGWGNAYNFGSRAAVLERWKAALDAGVDLIASDQYEDLAKVVNRKGP